MDLHQSAASGRRFTGNHQDSWELAQHEITCSPSSLQLVQLHLNSEQLSNHKSNITHQLHNNRVTIKTVNEKWPETLTSSHFVLLLYSESESCRSWRLNAWTSAGGGYCHNSRWRASNRPTTQFSPLKRTDCNLLIESNQPWQPQLLRWDWESQ